MDQKAWAERIRSQIEYEREREGFPEGFPGLPAIPCERYTDPDFFRLEQESLWKKTWLLVGRDEDFEGPGSFQTFERTGSPLLIVRGMDGALRAFFNTCQHRGAPVVREKCGTTKRLRCQYHSWAYDLDGQLLNVPDAKDFPGLDRSRLGLKPVRCETYDGWVFVNEDLDAQPLRAWLGPVAEEWSPLCGDTLRSHGSRLERVPANWKVVADAFLETYHLSTIHSNTVADLLDHRGAAMGLFEGGHSRMVTPKWPEAIARQAEKGSPLPQSPGLDPLFAETNPAYSVFPNLITPLDTIGFPFILFWPVDVGTTDVEWTFFGPPAPTPEVEKAWEFFIQVFDFVMEEDFQNLAPMQRSIASGGLASIPLSYQERRIYHLHEEIDRLIGPQRVPTHLRVEPVLEAFWERG